MPQMPHPHPGFPSTVLLFGGPLHDHRIETRPPGLRPYRGTLAPEPVVVARASDGSGRYVWAPSVHVRIAAWFDKGEPCPWGETG